MTKIKNHLLLLLLLALFTSCATIIQGPRQRVAITTEPSTASIYINDKYIGSGFATKRLSRRKTHKIMVVQENYNTFYQSITNHIQPGWIICDVLFGFFPFVVDISLGSFNAFDQNSYNINLHKK